MCSIELGRIYIMMGVSCLSQHMCSPREGNIGDVYRIFSYLQNNLGKNPGRMAYNPIHEPTNKNSFEVVGKYLDEWKDFYPESQEMIPSNIPELLGKYVVIKYYVDANHAGNMANGGYHSGIIVYVDNAHIIW